MAIAFLLCCIFVIQLLNGDRCCWDRGIGKRSLLVTTIRLCAADTRFSCGEF
ncbi:hypothetical protein ACWATR_39765 [Nostoc sp. UIC 10890]